MIELRAIGYFATACRSSRLAEGAARLQIAPSTLTDSIKGLEAALSQTLLRRANGVSPTAAGRVFLRKADRLLAVERFARRSLSQTRGPSRSLTLDLRLTFTIGRVSGSLEHAIETFGTRHPDVFVRVLWTEDGDGRPEDADLTLMLDSDGGDGAVLLQDRWVLAVRLPAGARTMPTASDLLAGRVVVPHLSPTLADQAGSYLRRCRARRVRFAAEHAGDLPDLIQAHPDAAVFAPESMLSDRLGLANVRTVVLTAAPPARILAQSAARNALAKTFLAHWTKAIAAGATAPVSTPQMTSKQIRYFGLVHRLRRVSAAARAARTSQPSISEQLLKLERSLGEPLFERKDDGMEPTARGDALAPLARMIEAGLEDLAASAEPSTKARVTIGVLPSVNQHGFLAEQIAKMLAEVRRRRPRLSVTLQVAPNAVLQEWVGEGRVGIAVVETALPHMPRLPLGSSEPLAAIASAHHGVLAPGPVRLGDLLRRDLALPSTLFGLRRLLEDAATRLGQPVAPRLEIDDLAMATAVLRHLPVCTVLPPSAIRREIESGELTAHPIIEPTIRRDLYVIYSGARALTDAEREIVALLRARLQAGDGPAR